MRWSKKMTTVVAVGALGIGGAIAYAAWNVTGSGSGQAKAATAAAVTIQNPATIAGDLYPGGSGDLSFKVTNPNSFPVKVTAVTPNGEITSDKGAACNGPNITFAGVSGLSQVVAANGSADVVLDGAVTMIADAADGCQGALFSVPISVAAQSNV